MLAESHSAFKQQHHALIICDLQNDLLKSIPSHQSKTLFTTINAALECIRSKEGDTNTNSNTNSNTGSNTNSKWTVIFTGLKFQKDYANVPIGHKLYGGMKRLNSKMGNNAAHWFMEGYDGVNITNAIHNVPSHHYGVNDDNNDDNNDSNNKNEYIIWRDCHLPSGDKLQSILTQKKITNTIVCGMKTSTTIQSTIQLLCDLGIQTSVLKEGVTDDNLQRHESLMEFFIPVFADVISLSELMDSVVGIENISENCREALIEVASSAVTANTTATSSKIIVPTSSSSQTNNNRNNLKTETTKVESSNKVVVRNKVFRPTTNGKNDKEEEEKKENTNKLYFCTDCERGGHGKRYIQFLLERPNWKTYPSQPWYENFHGAFSCPMGKKIVDFCDEPDFSNLSMYLSGREWLDEKDKVILISHGYMPTTYTWEPSSLQKGCMGQWKDGLCPPSDSDDDATASPWFVKEADKNLGGPYIGICQRPSEISNFIKNDKRYVVQQHVKDPLLTDDGKKTHVKFYILLLCEDDGKTWTLYTYKNAKLSISPNPWSPTDLSQDTQVTIHRHPVPPSETIGWKQHWEKTYVKCQQGTADVIERAIQMGKLLGRKGKRQFEVFSADWMPDEHGNIWLFEFNMSPAVCQKEFEDLDKRDERRDKLMKDDEIMMRDALDIALPWEGGSGVGLWDKVDILKEKPL